MVDTTIDPFPYERLDQLDTAIARLRYILIALLIVMIAGFAFLGVQIARADSRIDQLAAKVDGLELLVPLRVVSINFGRRRGRRSILGRLERRRFFRGRTSGSNLPGSASHPLWNAVFAGIG